MWTAQTTKSECLLQDQFQARVLAWHGRRRGINWFTRRKYIISFLVSCASGSRLNTAHYNSKVLTAQCAELRRHNVCLRMDWFTGECDRTFSVANRPASRTNYFADILRKIKCRILQTLSSKEFKQTIHDFFKDKNVTPLAKLRKSPCFPHTTCWPSLPPRHTKTTKQERLTLSMRHG